MSPLTAYGALAVGAMLVFYALERRFPPFALAACDRRRAPELRACPRESDREPPRR